MDAAGVCDTPLQYWGLSSDKLTIILVHPPIPSILVQIPAVQKNNKTISRQKLSTPQVSCLMSPKIWNLAQNLLYY